MPLQLEYRRFIAALHHGVEVPGFFVADLAGEKEPIEMPRHTHESAYFSFIIRGRFQTSAREFDGICGPGSLVYHPPGTTHSDRFLDGFGRFLTISITPSHDSPTRHVDSLPPLPVGLEERGTRFLGTRLLCEIGRSDGFTNLAVEGLALELVEGFQSRRSTAKSTEPSWLATACEFLHDHSGGSLTVRQVAASVDVHAVHLARVFRRHRGCTPGDYLRHVRVERALGQVRAGRALSDVAIRCGFADQSGMNKSFRRVLGHTPGVYRAMTRPLI